MDAIDPIRTLLAFVFVLGLIGLCAFLAKRFLARTGFVPVPTNGARIKLLEVKMLDTKRKVVLLKIDDKEHAILLSHDRELLLQTNDTVAPDA